METSVSGQPPSVPLSKSSLGIGIFIATLLVLIVLLFALGKLWGTGLEPLELPSSLWTAVALAALFGALGGLAYDIAEPLRPTKGWSPEWFENRTTVPHIVGKSNTTVEWGFLGPALVGAVAAMVSVFLFAVNTPTPPEEQPAGTQITTPTVPYINPDSLIVIGLVAGFAGPIVLRTARSRLADVLKTANVITVGTQKLTQATTEAEQSVAGVAETVQAGMEELIEEGLPEEPEDAARVVADLATQASQQAASDIRDTRQDALTALQQASGVGNPEFD